MLDVEKLTLRLGDAPLFNGVGFRVTRGQRVAIAGRNGQGKSTLMKVILGRVSVDAGKVTVAKGHTLGYLPQDISPPKTDVTAIEEAMNAIPELAQLEIQIHHLTDQMSTDPEDDSLLDAYGKAQAKFEALDGYAIEAKARAILAGLGFTQARMNSPLNTLSGGWLMRVHLGKLLLQNPDLMLLDEPTNHLDIESREWLLEWLQGFSGALMLTSHDRYFLDHLVQKVFLIESGKLDVYHGNYSDYEIKRAADLDRLRAAFVRQQKELKRQERFIEKNRAKAATASNVQSRIKQVAKIEIIKLPPEPPKMKLRFPEPKSSGQLAFRLTDVGKSYGDLSVLSGVDLELPAGEKLALVGVNGAGKTTLLKLISGAAEASAGSVELGHNVLIQTFSQYEDDLPNPSWSLLQAMEEAAPPDCSASRRTILGCFLFSDDDVHKRISVISGGERARLKLARMLLRPSNLLILDEPTNHLDLHSKDVLLSAVKAFKGTVLFVSHDRDFLAALATSVLEIKDGKAIYYPCDYEQYRWRVERDAKEAAAARASAAAPLKAEPIKKDAKQRRVQKSREDRRLSRERKKTLARLQRRVEKVQQDLESKETRQAELEELMSTPGFFEDRAASEPIVGEHKQLQMLIGVAYEELEQALEAVEAAETAVN